MRKFMPYILLLSIFIGMGGCVIVNDTLDYRNDLSDYEAKKIVKKVLVSQQTIGMAALINNESLQTFSAYESYAYTRYECSESGYISLQIDGDGFAVNLSAGDILNLNYYDCAYERPWYSQSRINGPVTIDYHQYMHDYQSLVSDFTLTFNRTAIQSVYGLERIDGVLGVHLDQDYRHNQLQLTLSTNRLVVENSNWEREIFNNIVLDFMIDTYTNRYSYSYSGTLYSDYLGTLTFSTLTPMQGYGEHNPAYGSFKISNEHVSLTVKPVDDYYVDIILDNHLYPTKNRIIRTTWINIGL
jgi:hypothetical protein